MHCAPMRARARARSWATCLGRPAPLWTLRKGGAETCVRSPNGGVGVGHDSAGIGWDVDDSGATGTI